MIGDSGPINTAAMRIRATTIGEPERLSGGIELFPYDDDWPRRYEAEARQVASVLGDRALRIQHVGSTSVPGLMAKPVIDMLLAVADSSDEACYVPILGQAGYVLRIRERDWYEHRLFKRPGVNINLHVFSAGCPEIDRMIDFRDRLRSDVVDRELYQRTKLELAARHWNFLQEYADAKSAVVEAIIARARADRTRGLPADVSTSSAIRMSRRWTGPATRRA
jgi:GrpB-like predicted nucleotidyltransferase (UPF0157 family)